MSNNNPDEYQYIKALVRGLHIPKNVKRPDGTLLSPRRNDEPDTVSATTDDDDDDYERLSTVEEKVSTYRRSSELRLTKSELNRLRKQHKQTIRANRKQPAHHRSYNSLNVPSVVVTGVNEHTDLLTSTQRRFSQLYSGIRRFSASHTVCVYWIFFRFCL